MQTRAILSLGSNIEPRLDWLRRAIDALCRLPHCDAVCVSPIYETEPADLPEGSAGSAFLNCIVTIDTSLTPEALSTAIHAIEDALGRERTGLYGAPRTLDIDLIAFGDEIRTTPELCLPHPRAAHRRFVLQPLADLLPDYRLPGSRQTLSERLAACPKRPAVQQLPAVIRHIQVGQASKPAQYP